MQSSQPLQTYAFLSPLTRTNPCIHLSLERSREPSDVVGQLAVVAQELDVCTIDQDLALGLLLHIFFAAERSEAPVLGDDDLLAARELVL
jgi:hypothetical protein